MDHIESVPLLSLSHENDETLPNPPAYSGPRWSNVRPLGSDLVITAAAPFQQPPVIAEAAIDTLLPPPAYSPAPSSSPALIGAISSHAFSPTAAADQISAFPRSQPMALLYSPHRLRFCRGHAGFGFSISGQFPVNVVAVDTGGPAESGGLLVGDKILELNGVDATGLSLETVSTMISSTSIVELIVVSSPSNEDVQTGTAQHQQQFQMNVHHEPPTIAMDTMPATNIQLAIISLFFCPLFGIIAIYHALKVSSTWRAREILVSYRHATLARKNATTGFIYGVMCIIVLLAVRASVQKRP